MSKRAHLFMPIALGLLVACGNTSSMNKAETNSEKEPEAEQIGDRKGFNVNGPVKSIRTMELVLTEENGELIVTDTTGNRQVSFNDAGMLVETVFYGSDDTITYRETREYNNNGHLTRKVQEELYWQSKETTVYERDSDGRITNYEVFIDKMHINKRVNGLKSRVQYEYDAEGSLARKAHYGSDSILYSETIVKRLDNGHRIEDERRLRGDFVWWRYEREYDENDQFIRYSSIDSNNQVVDETKYRWNEKGEWIDRINIDEDGWEKDEFGYNKNGEVVSITTLDSVGNVTSKTTFEPELDGYGNLVYELKRIDGNAARAVKKTISYFK